jgi:hypothetical protein
VKKSIGKENIKELAAHVCGGLNKEGIDAVLVGGACVSIYTQNEYESSDLDFVAEAELKKMDAALAGMGFSRPKGERHYKRPGGYYFIEFVAAPVAVGREIVKSLKKLKTRFGVIKMLSPTDSVKDRLAAFFHWNDHQSLEQAIMITKKNRVDLKEIGAWAKREGKSGELKIFFDKSKRAKARA